MSLADRIHDRLVREETGGDKEPLPTCLGDFDSTNMRKCHITNIHIKEYSCRRNLLFKLALNDVSHALVGGVDSFKRIQIVNNGTKDERRVDCGDVKVGLLLLDKVPSSLLSEGLEGISRSVRLHWLDAERAYLAGSINIGMIHSLLPGNWVPFFLAVDLRVLLRIHNGGK